MNTSAHDCETEKNRVEKGTLYLVATPIGNLMDLSPRACKVLREVDFVAAEDTRNTAKLLNCFDIRQTYLSYFEHNKRQRGEEIVRRLLAGESCALVTDAGTPAISDPGEDLVALCAEQGVPVTSVPGCCAAIDALSLSGLPTARFSFEGFLPASATQRKKRLEEICREQRTLIFYEAPHRLLATLTQMYEVLGERPAALCRELTKRNEEVQRLPLSRAVAYYESNEPRGEYVVVVGGCTAEQLRADAFWSEMTVEEHVQYYLDTQPDCRKNDAIKLAARDRGVAKNVIYRQLVQPESDENK